MHWVADESLTLVYSLATALSVAVYELIQRHFLKKEIKHTTNK